MASERKLLQDISNLQDNYQLAVSDASKSNSKLKFTFQKRIPLITGRWFIDAQNENNSTSSLKIEGFDESNYVIWYLGEAEVLSFILTSQKFVLVKLRESAALKQTLKDLKSNYTLNSGNICLDGCIRDINNDLILLETLIEFPLAFKDIIDPQEQEEKIENNWGFSIGTESITEQTDTIQEISLTLNRLEVSFLIGHKGRRIEYLKQECKVDIKIMPISYKLTYAELQEPTRVVQEIRIYGNLQNLQKSIVMIEQCLRIAPLSAKAKFQGF